jgi:hypothetical protein
MIHMSRTMKTAIPVKAVTDVDRYLFAWRLERMAGDRVSPACVSPACVKAPCWKSRLKHRAFRTNRTRPIPPQSPASNPNHSVWRPTGIVFGLAAHLEEKGDGLSSVSEIEWKGTA